MFCFIFNLGEEEIAGFFERDVERWLFEGKFEFDKKPFLIFKLTKKSSNCNILNYMY